MLMQRNPKKKKKKDYPPKSTPISPGPQERVSTTSGEQKAKLDVVAQVCHPSTQEMEAGRSGVQDHPPLHREFGSSTDFMRLTQKPVKEKKV